MTGLKWISVNIHTDRMPQLTAGCFPLFRVEHARHFQGTLATSNRLK
jgi:hypothetical protein